MYNKQYCQPIVLMCMSIGVPSSVNPSALEDVPSIKKVLMTGKGGMYPKAQILPLNKATGKKYFQKELLHRYIVSGTPCLSLPKPDSHSIKILVEEFIKQPPPESEHEFILGA